MLIQPIKTKLIKAKTSTLLDLIDQFVQIEQDKTILAITSKIVSLCEGSVREKEQWIKENLVIKEAQWYLPSTPTLPHCLTFTVKNHTLIPTAGIDESNADGNYVLWPKDPQKTANQVRQFLVKKFAYRHLGVIITDSTCSPLRRGTSGIYLAHSGFLAIKNYIGKEDLFGRDFHTSVANIAGGLAAASVVAMGEGREQTPLALLSDLPFIDWQERNPSQAELSTLRLDLNNDLFAPFFQAVKWKKGGSF